MEVREPVNIFTGLHNLAVRVHVVDGLSAPNVDSLYDLLYCITVNGACMLLYYCIRVLELISRLISKINSGNSFFGTHFERDVLRQASFKN